MSTIIVSNVSDGTDSAPATALVQGAPNVLCNFLHTTPSVTASYNISSVSDDGVGLFGPSFTNAFEDALYYSAHMCEDPDGASYFNSGMSIDGSGTKTSSSFEAATEEAGAASDIRPTWQCNGVLA